MSGEPVRVCLVGATGMIGQATLARSAGSDAVRLVAVARRQVALPAGAPTELLVGDTPRWPALIGATGADVLACAIGTTRRKAGTPEAFQAVDRDLVLACGKAARAAGIARMVVVSSVAADVGSRNLYLRTKGEMEAGLVALGFARLDILRPAQLMGPREERRLLERVAQVAVRGVDAFLQGPLRRYHSVAARDVADAILALARRVAPGRFIHEHDAIIRAARDA